MLKHDAHVTAWFRHMFRYDSDTGVMYWTEANKIEKHKAAGKSSKSKHNLVNIGGRRKLVHRIIWQIVYGYEPAMVDHADGDWTNNRLSNLRECTPGENSRNSLLAKNNKSGAKGVRMLRGRFDALIAVNGKKFYMGSFDTVDEAAHAYNKAAIRMHGEFAKLNPIGVDKEPA